jgi:hypothetical protein
VRGSTRPSRPAGCRRERHCLCRVDTRSLFQLSTRQARLVPEFGARVLSTRSPHRRVQSGQASRSDHPRARRRTRGLANGRARSKQTPLMPWTQKDAAKRLPVPLNRRFEIRPRKVSARPDACLAKQMHLDRAPWSRKDIRREPQKQMLPFVDAPATSAHAAEKVVRGIPSLASYSLRDWSAV